MNLIFAILVPSVWLYLIFVCNCCILVLAVSCLLSGSRTRCGDGRVGTGVVSGVVGKDMGFSLSMSEYY